MYAHLWKVFLFEKYFGPFWHLLIYCFIILLFVTVYYILTKITVEVGLFTVSTQVFLYPLVTTSSPTESFLQRLSLTQCVTPSL